MPAIGPMPRQGGTSNDSITSFLGVSLHDLVPRLRPMVLSFIAAFDATYGAAESFVPEGQLMIADRFIAGLLGPSRHFVP
jgi:hypothetical protein